MSDLINIRDFQRKHVSQGMHMGPYTQWIKLYINALAR